jgi:glycosyltransferase involved in cell wall biosynthesis
MTLLEAMSLGRPCVVTDAGGNPEIIKHKYNGLVTPNDDANEFAHAIMALANSQQTRDDMGLAAKKRFEELFSARSMTKHFEALYETLMNNIRT